MVKPSAARSAGEGPAAGDLPRRHARAARTGGAPLQAGFAALYKVLGVPVVPVAVDSGPLYHRFGGSGAGRSPTASAQPLPPGLPRAEIEARVQAQINALNKAPNSGPS